jgi:hypothetical protein
MNEHGARDSDPPVQAGVGFEAFGYEGAIGKTTLDRVHVTIPDGSIESIQVYTRVNVGSHPHLAEAAQQGRLHRFDTGEFLAIPWVYHDPGLERLLLVIPPSLRHRELSERAALMKAIADDSAVSVPRYVRDFQSVVGVEGLMEALAEASAPSDSIPPDQQQSLQRQNEALRLHEERLVAFQAQLEQERERLALQERELAEHARVLGSVPSSLDEAILAPDVLEAEPLSPHDDPVEEDDFAEAVEEITNLGDEDGDILLEPDVSHELGLLDDIPDVAAPDGFMESPVHAMAGALSEGSFWLFAKLGEEEIAPELSQLSLLLQLSIVDEIPVVMLTLVVDGAPRPAVRRLVLLPTRTEDRAILRYLAQNFCAKVLLFSSDGIYERELEIRVDLEANAQWMLNQVERYETRTDSEEQAAIERALAAPPPVHIDGHPFGAELPRPSTAVEALEQARRLGPWVSPESRQLALAALSIPVARVEAATHTTVTAAVGFGVATSVDLLSHAVELGLLRGLGPAVAKMIESRLLHGTEAGWELSSVDRADVWSHLLNLAWEYRVAIEQSTFDRAWEIIRAEKHDLSVPGESLSDDPAAWTDAEIIDAMRRPDHCIAVANELIRRAEESDIRLLVDLISRAGEPDLAAIGEGLLDTGEAFGSAMIDLLGANRPEVRHLAALILGGSGSRRAAVPLVAALLSEPTEHWREIARSVGLLGSGTSRPLARALKDPRGHDERLVYALTHLSAAGHGEMIEQWQEANDPMTAGIALRVPGTEDQVREHLEGVAAGEGSFPGVSLAHRLWVKRVELSSQE